MIIFFTIPTYLLAMIVMLIVGFIDIHKGIILTLIDVAIGSIFAIAAVYFVMGIYKIFFEKYRDGQDIFEGIITAAISVVVMRVWWQIFIIW